MPTFPATFEPLAEARRQTLELIKELKQSDFDRRPADPVRHLGEAGRWSPGEIVDHVLRVFQSLTSEVRELIDRDERGEATVLRRTFRDYDVAPVPIPKSLMPVLEPGFRALNAISRRTFPASLRERILRNRVLPVKNPTQWVPEANRPAEDLRTELQTSIQDLRELLERQTRKPLDELVLSHTIFGSYSVPELLGVLEVHETWHHEDLGRLARVA